VRARRLLATCALVAAAALGLPAGAHAGAQAASASDPNPLAGQRWFVDWRDQPSAQLYRRYKREGRRGDAALMYKIASQPIFRWMGLGDRNPEAAARNYLSFAQQTQPGSAPGITVMAHRGEKCGSGYTAGGRRADGRYRRWIRRFARGVGGYPAIIALEPDSLGTLKCIHGRRRKSRLRNMRFAARALSKLPNATVYIDGGASDWRPAREMARYLHAAGVGRVRGFMLNSTHFDTTARSIRYGVRLSRMLHGKHFVVNTDENGNGALRYRRWISHARHLWRTVNVWCNPKNSALGHPPTADTGNAKADALLWISRPAASAGPCWSWSPRFSMRGGPNAGTFWPERALMLARAARW
jgi:endoglucanase